MKRFVYVFICITCCISCKQKKQARHFEIKKLTTSSNLKIDSTSKKVDSFFLKALAKALMLAKTSKKARFNKKFSTGSEDLNNKIDVEVKFGHLFDKSNKDLLIVMASNVGTRINIYHGNKTDLKLSVTKNYGRDSYLGYLIKDINGDSAKDFLINWHPLSGCCMRNIYDLYLSQPDKTLSKEIELANPVFFPKEKIIRGITYDHPGLASLYKFKWKGLNLDTIEYIYPNLNDTLEISFLRSHKSRYYSKNNESKKLSSIPNEYHSLIGIDYFRSYNIKDIKVIAKNYNN